jgi:hypothetical protein
MIPKKAWILKTSNPTSIEYAKSCSDSCDKIGMPWEYVEWVTEGNAKDAWDSIGMPIGNFKSFKAQNSKAQYATSGHAMIWKKILDSGEPGIVLEHDAVMLHKINIEIPDNAIVVLGYKFQKPESYNHEEAGPPQEIIDIKGHEGAHAYAITPRTAEILFEELKEKGVQGAIDNTHFLKSRKTSVPLKIMSPTPAIGWLRQSTIWKTSATRNETFISSFQKHYNKS